MYFCLKKKEHILGMECLLNILVINLFGLPILRVVHSKGKLLSCFHIFKQLMLNSILCESQMSTFMNDNKNSNLTTKACSRVLLWMTLMSITPFRPNWLCRNHLSFGRDFLVERPPSTNLLSIYALPSMSLCRISPISLPFQFHRLCIFNIKP